MYSTNMSKRQKLLNTATKARLIHKSVEATEELIGNKIAKQIAKRKYLPNLSSKNFEEIVISPGKRQEILKMEYHKIINNSNESKFAIEVSDLSNEQYSVNKNIWFKTSIVKSNLCGYSDTYIVVKETKTVAGTNANNQKNKGL